MAKIRELTPEELKSITVTRYDDGGFSLWIKQPKMDGQRVILDASTFPTTGKITLHPPRERSFVYGSIITGNEISLVVI